MHSLADGLGSSTGLEDINCTHMVDSSEVGKPCTPVLALIAEGVPFGVL